MITKDEVIEILKTVYDPEIQLDVWTMGLIYNIEIEGDVVKILMTYTTPFCPFGPQLNEEIIRSIKEHPGAKEVDITLTFDPPYKMPDDLRSLLGI